MSKNISVQKSKINKSNSKKRSNYIMLFVVLGISFFIIMWIVEINFHYIQGFKPNGIENELFWRAEYAQVLNTLIFLFFSIFFIVIAIMIKMRKY